MNAKPLNTAAHRLIGSWLIAAGLFAALPGWAAEPDPYSPGQVQVTATARRAPDAADPKAQLAWDRVGAPMQALA